MKPARRGALAVAAAALLWSSGGLAIKWIGLSPLGIVFHRAWIAAITLLLLLRPARVKPNRTLAAASIVYAGMIISFVVATRWTTAANAIFLQDSGIVWVLLFSPLIAREKIGKNDVVAASACLGGMALFFVGRLSTQGMAGNWMSLVSGVFYAATVLLLRRQGGAAAQWTAILGNLLAAILVAPFISSFTPARRSDWAVLLFLGVVQIGVAYSFFVRGIGLVPAAEASIIALLEPIFNPIWVYIGIGERPTKFALLGAGIVVSAIAWRTLASGGSPAAAVPSPD